MEDKFYLRPTGKLRKSASGAYGSHSFSRKSQDSVYSLDDHDIDSPQYPMGELSRTQKKFITSYLSSMCMSKDVDANYRSIHWVGSWRVEDNDITVTISMVQPNISACSITLSRVLVSSAVSYSGKIFSEESGIRPHINRTSKYAQLMGKFSVVFADEMVDRGFIREEQVQHTNVVLTNTQLMFCIVQGNSCHECILTHTSCRILMENSNGIANITPKGSTGHNYTFRSPSVRTGSSTGPSLTVHTSGTMQYQGNPRYIEDVMSSFRRCIEATMASPQCMRFLRSLSEIRESPVSQ